jgi:hypothetical protein
MRLLSAIFVLLFSFNSNAEQPWEFTCTTDPNGFSAEIFSVKANVSGEMQKQDDRYLLNFEVSYVVLEDSCTQDCEWSKMNFRGKAKNNPNYNPRNFKGYSQFDFGTRHVNNNYGEFKFLFPQYKKSANLPGTFEAYLIMTHVNDHFGTTVPLSCSY